MKDFQEGKPENYEELKRKCNKKSDWKARLKAVEELGRWKCQESIDILWRRMLSDDVYDVQTAAFLRLQAFGEKVTIPKKKKGNLIKGVQQELLKVKKKLPENHSYEDFKELLKINKPIIYDTYEGDKKGKFDKWLKNSWDSLPKEK